MTEIDGLEDDRLRKLLRDALPPVESEAEPGRDLWPALLKRLDAKSASVPWFDWALLGGLMGLAAFFPAAIPVFLYYL
jgi:hypothetical protein